MRTIAKKISYALCLALCSGSAFAQDEAADESVLDLDLGQLGQIAVPQAATMTPTTARRVPASVTVIDRQMIKDSGARSLFDLLEIHVPALHYLPHHWEATHMGMRGIMSDREDKYLILVNGRVLNEKTHYGAMSERDMPMLDDIRRIDVVRGPGSVVYGPGAVSMVINIQTESFSDYSGDAFTQKIGAIENFVSLEAKQGFKFKGDRHGLLLYLGGSKYDGADQRDAPLVYGNSFYTTWGEAVHAGQPVPFSVSNKHEAYRDQAKIKFHADYQYNDFRAWLRYTRGGEQLAWEHKIVAVGGYPTAVGSGLRGTSLSEIPEQGVGYQQVTLDVSQRWNLGADSSLEVKGGYDSFDYERTLTSPNFPWNRIENHREEEYIVRSTLNSKLSETQSAALGAEFIQSYWGLKGWGYPDTPPASSLLGVMTPWKTSSLGVFGEHQWQVTDSVTSFVGLRLDKDQYTKWMISPRWAMVFAPNEQDTFKAILSRSVRKNIAEELRREHLAGGVSKPEILQGIEGIYQHRFDRAWSLDFSTYYNNIDVLGYNSATLGFDPVASFSVWGGELELGYKLDQFKFSFSHAYNKLMEFHVEPGVRQKLSVANLGYGDDLSNWSNHISKLAAVWSPNDVWRVSTDLRIFWGYPGAKNVTQNTNDINDHLAPGSFSSTAVSDRGYADSFKKSVFFDLGLQYKLTKSDVLGFNMYNILGWLDKSYNKRMYVVNVSNYRSEAASVAITYQVNF